jgi:hypothetical protein
MATAVGSVPRLRIGLNRFPSFSANIDTRTFVQKRASFCITCKAVKHCGTTAYVGGGMTRASQPRKKAIRKTECQAHASAGDETSQCALPRVKTSVVVVQEQRLGDVLTWGRQIIWPIVRTFAYSVLAAGFFFLISTKPARAAGRQPVSTAAPQPSKTAPEKESQQKPVADIDWGRSLPEEEDWDAEERAGLESDLKEHDARDIQIDRAFEEAETSESDTYWKETKESTTEETKHHWEGDLSAYDRQLKAIKAEAEKTKKKKAAVISWPLRIASARESHPMEWVKLFILTQGKHVVLTRRLVSNHAALLKKVRTAFSLNKHPQNKANQSLGGSIGMECVKMDFLALGKDVLLT